MGWLVPGRFRDKIIQMKFAGNLLSGGIFQHAVADYMQSGNFNRHLRNLRAQTALPHGARAGADRAAFPGRLQSDEAVRRLHVLDRGTARLRFSRRLSWRAGTRRRPAARPAFLGARSFPQLYRRSTCRFPGRPTRRRASRRSANSFASTPRRARRHAAAARPHSSAVASLAPSASASSFAHMIEG